MKRLLVLLLLCLPVLMLRAQQLYEDKNIKFFPDVIKAEAAKGNVIAIQALGDGYNFGNFEFSTDYDKALECYKRVAEFGYPWGAWEIARMYAAGKLTHPDVKKIQKIWFDKAFKEFKIYADRGDEMAMDKLAEFYEGFWGDEYEDALKNLYWSLRALDAGNPNGASNIARLYTYNAEFKRDSVFAYAWDARFCIGAGKKNWPVESYPSYEKLQKAGYSRTDWEGLAELTYLPVPQVSAENQDSINDVAIFAIDLLKVRAEDFRIAYNVHKRNVSSISMASAEKGSFTSSTIPSATYEETRNAASRRKRNWLSAIGRALDVVNTAVNGGNVWTAAAQGMSIASGGQVPGNGVNASMLEVFKYNGEQRKGMKDFNGRVIRNELTAPCVYGQAHYTWYEDGFCFVCSVSTCVGCYGRKICTVCSGRGQIYHAYFKNYVQCGACLGAGRCKYCQGAGCKVTTKLWAPGEAEAYQAAKREEVGDYSLGGGSSSNSHSGVCPKCGGKGYRAEAYTYAAGSSVAPYHNSGGTSCYICGKATDHYHYRCTECKRH